MALTIFYSWQSDIPNKINRTFIENALRDAIKAAGQDIEIQEALRDEKLILDHDTKGVPGMPPIVDVIFKKISTCGIFVPDLTFVGKSDEGRLLPNPNVLIEYGWALKELGNTRIIGVMNEALGEPTGENLPFDMRHLRRPITYYLSEDTSREELSETKKQLVADLTNAIKAIIASGILMSSPREDRSTKETPFTSNPSTFLQPGEAFIVDHSEGTDKPHHLPDVARLFLRVIPTKPFSPIKSQKVAFDLVSLKGLRPMGADFTAHTNRNKRGAIAYEDSAPILTQLFLNGELWGIDAHTIDKKRLLANPHVEVSFGYFPFGALTRIFEEALMNYLKFASEALKLPLPLRFIAGATDVEGYRTTPPPGKWFLGYERFRGRVVNQHIIFEGKIDSYDQEVFEILKPFYAHVFEECGLTAPEIYR